MRRAHVVVAVLLACASARAAEPEQPPPGPTPALELSTKPMPGCCCYANAEAPGGWGCDWGLQEAKCRDVGAFLGLAYRWTPGRCAPQATRTP